MGYSMGWRRWEWDCGGVGGASLAGVREDLLGRTETSWEERQRTRIGIFLKGGSHINLAKVQMVIIIKYSFITPSEQHTWSLPLKYFARTL